MLIKRFHITPELTNAYLVNTNDITIDYVRKADKTVCDINEALITLILKVYTKVRARATFFDTNINIQDAVTYKHRLNL